MQCLNISDQPTSRGLVTYILGTTMKRLLLGSIALATSVSLAHAAPISFLFASPTGDLGSTRTYSTGAPPLSVIAAGFGGVGSRRGVHAVNLYGKYAGAGERGLGLVNDPTGDHEITFVSFIQLDVQDLFSKVASMSAKFAFDSTTGSEAYAVYGSNTAGALGTFLTSGKDENMHARPEFSTYRYYDFGSYKANGNVLLREISTYQTVPEPAGIVLVGAGLIALGLIRRRAGRI